MTEFLGAKYATPFVMTREVNSDVVESINFRRFIFSSTAYRHKFQIPLMPQSTGSNFSHRLKHHQNGFGYERSFNIPMPQFPDTFDDDSVVLRVGDYPTDRIPRDTAIRNRSVPIVKVSGRGSLTRDILPKLDGRFISLGRPLGIHQVYYSGGESINLLDADFNDSIAAGTINIKPDVTVFHDVSQPLSIRFVNGILCTHTLNVVEDVDSVNRVRVDG